MPTTVWQAPEGSRNLPTNQRKPSLCDVWNRAGDFQRESIHIVWPRNPRLSNGAVAAICGYRLRNLFRDLAPVAREIFLVDHDDTEQMLSPQLLGCLFPLPISNAALEDRGVPLREIPTHHRFLAPPPANRFG